MNSDDIQQNPNRRIPKATIQEKSPETSGDVELNQALPQDLRNLKKAGFFNTKAGLLLTGAAGTLFLGTAVFLGSRALDKAKDRQNNSTAGQRRDSDQDILRRAWEIEKGWKAQDEAEEEARRAKNQADSIAKLDPKMRAAIENDAVLPEAGDIELLKMMVGSGGFSIKEPYPRWKEEHEKFWENLQKKKEIVRGGAGLLSDYVERVMDHYTKYDKLHELLDGMGQQERKEAVRCLAKNIKFTKDDVPYVEGKDTWNNRNVYYYLYLEGTGNLKQFSGYLRGYTGHEANISGQALDEIESDLPRLDSLFQLKTPPGERHGIVVWPGFILSPKAENFMSDAVKLARKMAQEKDPPGKH